MLRFIIAGIVCLLSSAAFGQIATTPPGGRITINPGIAEMRTDYVGATTVYYAPSASGVISIYDGTGFTVEPIATSFNDAVGLSLPLNPTWATAATIFDAYVTSNPPVFCAVAWASSSPAVSHRAVPLAMAGGIAANSVATSCQGPSGPISMPQYQGVYVGKFMTAAAGQIDFKFGNAGTGGGGAIVSISNAYNRVPGTFVVQDTNSNWSTQTTPNGPSNISGWEPLDLPCSGCIGGQHNTITMITEGNKVDVSLNMGIYPNPGANIYVGVGLDYATAPVAGIWSKCAAGVGGPTGTSNIFHEAQARCSGYPIEGLHVLQAMELGTSGTTSGQLYSDQGGTTQVGGLIANWEW